eukprot:CAMPEP_0169302168 /NCGR_PEP_ID=MMETSP1016-20121227/68659_1 /TAXON_ID=342587 /ORGANISM="Karlodinium micrum, Strain CCMP2283" /LENGTH=78 /DNA_ID=CAMNT_0009394867 /DNA_START=185 /DNA_END=421 /DNA_ORIENTATION=+
MLRTSTETCKNEAYKENCKRNHHAEAASIPLAQPWSEAFHMLLQFLRFFVHDLQKLHESGREVTSSPVAKSLMVLQIS